MKKYFLSLVAYTLVFFVGSCSEEAIDEKSFGTLTGKVVAKGDNSPLANAKITSSPVSTTVFTDASGNYLIEDIQVGQYSVQAELSEFQTAFQAADVLEGKTVNVVFELDSVNVDNIAPTIPSLISPEEGAENILTETEFTWSSSVNDQDAITYTLELRNGETNEIAEYKELKDTTLTVKDLVIGKNYFWQVSANDGVNSPVKSGLGGFATKSVVSNRFLYVRNISGNNVIFSGSEPIGNNDDELNQNELQLTGSNYNSYRPSRNQTVEKIAFLRYVGADTHLFTMNTDGTGINQITSTIPLAGFRQDQLEYAWYDGGAKIYFPNFNKLYSINQDGSGIELVYQTGPTEFITEVAVSTMNDLVAIKTNDLDGYNAKIAVVDVTIDTEEVLIAGLSGALGGIDFSADGTGILFTRDVSEVQNTEYRQLDSRIFEYDLTTSTTTEIETSKDEGTNDLDAKYSPNNGSIIFVNTSNDGSSQRRIYRTTGGTANDDKEALFTNAFMPNWE